MVLLVVHMLAFLLISGSYLRIKHPGYPFHDSGKLVHQDGKVEFFGWFSALAGAGEADC